MGENLKKMLSSDLSYLGAPERPERHGIYEPLYRTQFEAADTVTP